MKMMSLSIIIPIMVLISSYQNIECNCKGEKFLSTKNNSSFISKSTTNTRLISIETTVPPIVTKTSPRTTTNIYSCSTSNQIILKPFTLLDSKIINITNAIVISKAYLDNLRESLACSCGSSCVNNKNCSYFISFPNVAKPEKNCFLYRFINFNNTIQKYLEQNTFTVYNHSVTSGFNNKTTGVGYNNRTNEIVTTLKPLYDLQ